MSKPLTKINQLSPIKTAPVNKKAENKAKGKSGLLTQKSSKMKTYRFRLETIEALEALTQAVNKKMNIKISTTNILELLVRDAAKGDVDKIIRLMNVQDPHP
jgi:hypothetical protein